MRAHEASLTSVSAYERGHEAMRAHEASLTSGLCEINSRD